MFVGGIAVDAIRPQGTYPTGGTRSNSVGINQLPKPSLAQYFTVRRPIKPYHDDIDHCASHALCYFSTRPRIE